MHKKPNITLTTSISKNLSIQTNPLHHTSITTIPNTAKSKSLFKFPTQSYPMDFNKKIKFQQIGMSNTCMIILENKYTYIDKLTNQKIRKGEEVIGTGFITKINFPNSSMIVLITNNHLISSDYLNPDDSFKLKFNQRKEPLLIKISNRFTYTEKCIYDGDGGGDFTIIEIKENEIKDYIDCFMGLDLKYQYKKIKNGDDYECNNSNEIMLFHFPKGKYPCVTEGIINGFVKPFTLIHSASTFSGSSGSPIVSVSGDEPLIIGIHKGKFMYNYDKFINGGTSIGYIINKVTNYYNSCLNKNSNCLSGIICINNIDINNKSIGKINNVCLNNPKKNEINNTNDIKYNKKTIYSPPIIKNK